MDASEKSPAINRPHVLVDARFSETRRGGDRCRFELAACLNKSQSGRYTFLTYAQGADLLRKTNPAARILKAKYRPSRHPQSDFFEHVQLPSRARRVAADIYHGTFQVLPLISAAPIAIVTIHDLATFDFQEAYSSKFAAYMRMLIRYAAWKADHIITVSDATRRLLAERFPRTDLKTSVIHNGVGSEFLQAPSIAPAVVEEVRRRHKLPADYILYVGNLERKKNLARLVKAFHDLRANGRIHQSLVIVGARPDKLPDCGIDPQLIGEGSGVHFAGYVEDADLPALYRAAKLVAYPSLYEGFGMPVLEGMAAGIPVLTSNQSSLPEIAGDAALLVDAKDEHAIARGIVEALTNSPWRASAVQAGFERAATMTWQKNASKTIAIYESLWTQRQLSSNERTT